MSTATVTAGVAQVLGGLLLQLCCPASCSTGRPGCRTTRADTASALPRAAPPLEQDGHGRRNDARLPARARRDQRRGHRGRRAARPRRGVAPNWEWGTTRSHWPVSLALARFAAAAAAWDVGNGFSLMARVASSRSPCSWRPRQCLAGRRRARRGDDRPAGRRRGDRRARGLSRPALALGGVAFAVVIIAETGRQPVDNPDTHLELTMVHEGPLLSTRDATSPICSGPPLHGIGSCSSSPRRSSSPTLRALAQLGLLPVALVVLCAALALTETHTVKMRSARPPPAVGGRGRRAARHRRLARGDGVSGTVLWVLVSVGLAVVIVRRRSVAVALVIGQALLLSAVALAEAATGADVAAALAPLLRATPSARSSSSSSPNPRGATGAGRRGCLPRRPGGGARARAPLARARDRTRNARPQSGRCSRSSPSGWSARRRGGPPSSRCSASSSSRTAQLAAAELPGGSSSLAIELGVALDLTLIALVAAVFHERIFAEFGAGDTAALRGLRD